VFLFALDTASMMWIIVIGFFILAVIGAIVFVFIWMYESFVQKQFIEYCKQGGHKFLGESTGSLREKMLKTHLTTGQNRSMHVVMHSVGKRKVTTATWTNEIHTGKGSIVYTYQLALMTLDLRSGGYIYMRKEGLKDKMANVLGLNDLDFEHQEFSDRFYVAAKPDRFGFDFFHPRMIEIFLKKPEYGLIVFNEVLIVYKRVQNPEGIRSFFAFIMRKIPAMDNMKDALEFVQEVEKSVPKLLKPKSR